MNVNAIRERFLQRVRARTDEEKEAMFQNLETTSLGHLMCEREVFSFLSDSDYQTSDVTHHKFFVAETPMSRADEMSFDYLICCNSRTPEVFDEADNWVPPIAA